MWVAQEFSLQNDVNFSNLKMKGRDIVALGRDAFMARSPQFMGEILWEHLDILQKGKKTVTNNK